MELLREGLVAKDRAKDLETRVDSTRRVYDALAGVYPLSTMLYHARAHARAVEMSGIQDGMTVLEVATGSGEMFRRLARANPNGHTIGLDLSPNMAARTQRDTRRQVPHANVMCGAVDARAMPFRESTFDAIVCCYLFELLGQEDIIQTLREFRRVLRPGGRLTLVLIGQNCRVFNRLYWVANRVAPAFWGRQVDRTMDHLLRASRFRLAEDVRLRHTGYPSRVVVATR